jgi:hypothetical protein
VLFKGPNNTYEHAAIIDSDGAVYSKMGYLGAFRFKTIEQMANIGLGTPAEVLIRFKRR